MAISMKRDEDEKKPKKKKERHENKNIEMKEYEKLETKEIKVKDQGESSGKLAKKTKKMNKKETLKESESDSDSETAKNAKIEGKELKKKRKKARKKERKEKRKKRKERNDDDEITTLGTSLHESNAEKDETKVGDFFPKEQKKQKMGTPAVDSTPVISDDNNDVEVEGVTLLLFYQYIEPLWSPSVFRKVLNDVEVNAKRLGVTGRMRVAREGLNCTLTGSYRDVRRWCDWLRSYRPSGQQQQVEGQIQGPFTPTEFKLTDGLPRGQAFPSLKCFPVTELVHYGLENDEGNPPKKTKKKNCSLDEKEEMTYSRWYGKAGVHLEPSDFHAKMSSSAQVNNNNDKDNKSDNKGGESGVVVIDVRNHYEVAIGRFDPPKGVPLLDPKMRKSTDFVRWLDAPETRKQLANKEVLMYCTGGIRCERASAVLRQRIEDSKQQQEQQPSNEKQDTKHALHTIKGVYQLQGGVDKYFKEFPDGGYWKGANYTFDKRFSHRPGKAVTTTTFEENSKNEGKKDDVLGRCEACSKPWDKYRGKRRCPTCGVPSLICKECVDGGRVDDTVRCQLCVEENITSKAQYRQREEEAEVKRKSTIKPKRKTMRERPAPHDFPAGIETKRLFLKNLCRDRTDLDSLRTFLGSSSTEITHVQWLTDRTSGKFYGSAFVETDSPESAARAERELHRTQMHGRTVTVIRQPPNPKDLWPPPHCAV